MNRSQPQTRQFREREQARNRPQTRFIHVREQSVNTASPRKQTPEQSVRIRDQASAADTICPQTVRSLEPSTSAISPLANIDRESRLAMNCSSHRLVVSNSPPTSVPVHIRIIRSYASI